MVGVELATEGGLDNKILQIYLPDKEGKRWIKVWNLKKGEGVWIGKLDNTLMKILDKDNYREVYVVPLKNVYNSTTTGYKSLIVSPKHVLVQNEGSAIIIQDYGPNGRGTSNGTYIAQVPSDYTKMPVEALINLPKDRWIMLIGGKVYTISLSEFSKDYCIALKTEDIDNEEIFALICRG